MMEIQFNQKYWMWSRYSMVRHKMHRTVHLPPKMIRKGVGKKPHQQSRSRVHKSQAPVSAPSPFPSTVPSPVPSPTPSPFPSTVPSPVPSPTPSPIYHTMPNQVNQVLLQCFIYTIFILAYVNYCHL